MLLRTYTACRSAPVTHQDQGLCALCAMLKTRPLVRPACTDPRKSSVPCRVQLDVLQILWFLANPFVAHDIGESGKTNDCRSKQRFLYYMGAAATNQVLWINTNPFTGSLPHPNSLTENLAYIIGYLITHDVIRCPGYLVSQCLDSNYSISLSLFALIEPLRSWTESHGKVCCFYVCP